MTIYPPCDMLIDQNRYIGSDPIGHACSNKATHTDGTYNVCESCLRMFKDEPERITIPFKKPGSHQQWMNKSLQKYLSI